MSMNVHRLRPTAALCNQAVDGTLMQSERSAMTEAIARKIEEIFDIL